MIKNVLEYLINLWYTGDNKVNYSRGECIMGNEELTVFDVANFFRKKQSMTHKKMQKLVYYAYAWYIALNNENEDNINTRLCNDCRFEAWIHGPVCPKLYYKYSDNYGRVDKYDGEINPLICDDIEKFLNTIYKVFGKYSGDELESMTHREEPWRKARKNLAPYIASKATISESDMFIYYNSLT